jgi:hydrogenase expression/formation protein HypE
MNSGNSVTPKKSPESDIITLAHGEGARLSRKLIRDEILSILGNPYLAPLSDGAILPAQNHQLVFATDAHVVKPLFFPGGDIGKLAVYGTVNDLAVCGAKPAYLSLSLVIEEGFRIADLRRVLKSIQEACCQCGVKIVTGDTKVVPCGVADGLFVIASGIGYLPNQVRLGPEFVSPGDRIIVSGTLGDHGVAVLAAREEGFSGPNLQSDLAPLHDLISRLLQTGGVVFLRDPTRGGVAAVLHELVEHRPWGVQINEASIPVSPAVRGVCEILGLDPLYIANEGKVVAVVREAALSDVLRAMHSHPLGRAAAVIGTVTSDTGRVIARGPLGQLRPVAEPAGAPLPRIC